MAFIRTGTALRAGSATVVASTSRSIAGTGILASDVAQVAGSSQRVVDGTGAPAAQQAASAGVGERSVIGSGALQAQSASVSGASEFQPDWSQLASALNITQGQRTSIAAALPGFNSVTHSVEIYAGDRPAEGISVDSATQEIVAASDAVVETKEPFRLVIKKQVSDWDLDFAAATALPNVTYANDFGNLVVGNAEWNLLNHFTPDNRGADIDLVNYLTGDQALRINILETHFAGSGGGLRYALSDGRAAGSGYPLGHVFGTGEEFWMRFTVYLPRQALYHLFDHSTNSSGQKYMFISGILMNNLTSSTSNTDNEILIYNRNYNGYAGSYIDNTGFTDVAADIGGASNLQPSIDRGVQSNTPLFTGDTRTQGQRDTYGRYGQFVDYRSTYGYAAGRVDPISGGVHWQPDGWTTILYHVVPGTMDGNNGTQDSQFQIYAAPYGMDYELIADITRGVDQFPYPALTDWWAANEYNAKPGWRAWWATPQATGRVPKPTWTVSSFQATGGGASYTLDNSINFNGSVRQHIVQARGALPAGWTLTPAADNSVLTYVGAGAGTNVDVADLSIQTTGNGQMTGYGERLDTFLAYDNIIVRAGPDPIPAPGFAL